jgi:hypothetical protein
MVGVHNKVGAVKIVPPGLECMDHCKEFLFMGWVIPLRGVHLTRGEGHWSRNPIGGPLDTGCKVVAMRFLKDTPTPNGLGG